MSQSQGCIIVDLPEDPQGLSQAKAHVQVDVIEAIPPEAKVMQVLKPDGHVTESSLDIKLTCNDVLFATLENETHCIVDGCEVEVGLLECKLIEVAWLGLAEVGDVSVMLSLFCTAPSVLTLKGLKGKLSLRLFATKKWCSSVTLQLGCQLCFPWKKLTTLLDLYSAEQHVGKGFMFNVVFKDLGRTLATLCRRVMSLASSTCIWPNLLSLHG